VDSIEIDYNDSSKAKDMMRIKRIEEGNYNIKKEKGSLNYAQYFVGV
jgi:hypothetical protein